MESGKDDEGAADADTDADADEDTDMLGLATMAALGEEHWPKPKAFAFVTVFGDEHCTAPAQHGSRAADRQARSRAHHREFKR